MAIKKSGPALVLGLVSVLALSTTMPSVAQTQRQRPAAQEQGFAPASPPADETFGQARAADTVPGCRGPSTARFVLDSNQ
jgi:hypothetical protein